MVEANISIQPSPKELAKTFKGLRESMRDWRDTWKRLLPLLARGLEENFDSEGRSLGVSWPALSQATIRAKGGDRQMLVVTGALRRSLSGKNKTKLSLRKMSMKVGSKHNLAAVHSFGARRQGIPARPFIGFSPHMRSQTNRIIYADLMHKLEQFVRGFGRA